MKSVILTSLLVALSSTISIASTDAPAPRVLLATLKVQPGKEAEFVAAAQNVIAESRKEPGNLLYNLQESVNDPQEFIFYELFKSDADFEAHRQAKHVVDFLAQVKPILIPGGFTLVKYENVNIDAGRAN